MISLDGLGQWEKAKAKAKAKAEAKVKVKVKAKAKAKKHTHFPTHTSHALTISRSHVLMFIANPLLV